MWPHSGDPAPVPRARGSEACVCGLTSFSVSEQAARHGDRVLIFKSPLLTLLPRERLLHSLLFLLLASDFHPFQNCPLQRKPAAGIPGFLCSHSWVASPCKVDGSADDQDACSDHRAGQRQLCRVWPQKPPLQPFRKKACCVHSFLCLPSSVPSSSRSLLPRLSGSA